MSPAQCWWLEWLCHQAPREPGCAQLVGDSPVPLEWHRPAQTVPGGRDVPFPVLPGKGDTAVPKPSFQPPPQHPAVHLEGRAIPGWAQSPGAVPGPVRVSVCVPGHHAAAVPVCLHWLCFICVSTQKKTTLKGATAAPGHSWNPPGHLRGWHFASWSGHRCHRCPR